MGAEIPEYLRDFCPYEEVGVLDDEVAHSAVGRHQGAVAPSPPAFGSGFWPLSAWGGNSEFRSASQIRSLTSTIALSGP